MGWNWNKFPRRVFFQIPLTYLHMKFFPYITMSSNSLFIYTTQKFAFIKHDCAINSKEKQSWLSNSKWHTRVRKETIFEKGCKEFFNEKEMRTLTWRGAFSRRSTTKATLCFRLFCIILFIIDMFKIVNRKICKFKKTANQNKAIFQVYTMKEISQQENQDAKKLANQN